MGPEPSAQVSAPPTDNRSRIAIPIKEDGTIDIGAMREATKTKLREALNLTPDFRQAQPTAAPQVFHPAMVSGLYDMMGSIESALAQRFFKIPEPVAKQVFAYSPQEKEALTGPTVRVLNKYAADWMIKYQDEITLASLLVTLTVQKVNAALIVSRMQRASTVSAVRQEEKQEKDEKEQDKPQVPN